MQPQAIMVRTRLQYAATRSASQYFHPAAVRVTLVCQGVRRQGKRTGPRPLSARPAVKWPQDRIDGRQD